MPSSPAVAPDSAKPWRRNCRFGRQCRHRCAPSGNSRSGESGIETAGSGKVIAISADIRTAAECARAFEEAQSALGQIDILVNNAGTSRRGPFLEISDEAWQDDFDLKVFSAIRFSKLVIPGMRERRWGRIINVLNSGAKTPPAEGAPTAVTRAAGMAIMKVLANENAPYNVLVNSMHVRQDPQ